MGHPHVGLLLGWWSLTPRLGLSGCISAFFSMSSTQMIEISCLDRGSKISTALSLTSLSLVQLSALPLNVDLHLGELPSKLFDLSTLMVACLWSLHSLGDSWMCNRNARSWLDLLRLDWEVIIKTIGVVDNWLHFLAGVLRILR